MIPVLYTSLQQNDDFGLTFATYKYSATLGATTDTTLTVPGGASRYKALIRCKPGVLVWVALNGTAAVPAGASFAATTSELIPSYATLCREVKAADVLHFYTATASTDVSVVFYALD